MKILSEKYLFSYSACRTIIYLILQFGKYFLAKHCQTVHFFNHNQVKIRAHLSHHFYFVTWPHLMLTEVRC